jgi:hypothetical protein
MQILQDIPLLLAAGMSDPLSNTCSTDLRSVPHTRRSTTPPHGSRFHHRSMRVARLSATSRAILSWIVHCQLRVRNDLWSQPQPVKVGFVRRIDQFTNEMLASEPTDPPTRPKAKERCGRARYKASAACSGDHTGPGIS